MRETYYLNEDNTYRPCSLDEWASQIEELRCLDKRRGGVGLDSLNGYVVSTVWLGLDHNYRGGEPLLFETMVFLDNHNFCDQFMYRYSTWNEAQKGHDIVVGLIRSGFSQKNNA